MNSTATPSLGILGTGRMGVRLATMFADAGHTVILGSRDLDRARRITAALDKPTLSAGTYESAAATDFILLAAFIRDGLYDHLEQLRPRLDGRILIDITNPFNDDYSDFIFPWNTSGGEELQKRFPRTRVVGAFKNVWWEVFDKPTFNGQPSDVYVVADDTDAKERFLKLVAGTPFRYLDAGRLANSRTIERMTLLSGELGQRYGFFPRMNYRLLGDENWQPGQCDRVAPLIAREEPSTAIAG